MSIILLNVFGFVFNDEYEIKTKTKVNNQKKNKKKQTKKKKKKKLLKKKKKKKKNVSKDAL